MDERTWAVIDLDRLKKNIAGLKKELSTSNNKIKILAVVKADAYGHGAVEVSEVLREEKIDYLGVASIDEACALEQIKIPIVILSPTSEDNIPVIAANGLIPAVSSYSFVNALNSFAKSKNKKIKVHIEVDTGMIRTGVAWENGVNFVSKVLGLENIEIEGVFTHLAEPEDISSNFTELQLDRFKTVLKGLASQNISIPLVHTASTSAILNFPDSYFNMIRPGILLYGLYSSPLCKRSIKINPILSLYTKVCEINEIPANTGISYGRTYITKKLQRIATLWVGYGDGYPRALSNKGSVIVRGKRAKIVGSVCMDLTMIDVTDIPEVKIGDKVTLVGREGEAEISTDEVAELAGTVNYEIITRICPRVPRVYINNGKPCKIRNLLGSLKI